MAGNGKNKSNGGGGWGDDDKPGGGKDEAVQPLTDGEVEALREVLRRNGYDGEKGTF